MVSTEPKFTIKTSAFHNFKPGTHRDLQGQSGRYHQTVPYRPKNIRIYFLKKWTDAFIRMHMPISPDNYGWISRNWTALAVVVAVMIMRIRKGKFGAPPLPCITRLPVSSPSQPTDGFLLLLLPTYGSYWGLFKLTIMHIHFPSSISHRPTPLVKGLDWWAKEITNWMEQPLSHSLSQSVAGCIKAHWNITLDYWIWASKSNMWRKVRR